MRSRDFAKCKSHEEMIRAIISPVIFFANRAARAKTREIKFSELEGLEKQETRDHCYAIIIN